MEERDTLEDLTLDCISFQSLRHDCFPQIRRHPFSLQSFPPPYRIVKLFFFLWFFPSIYKLAHFQRPTLWTREGGGIFSHRAEHLQEGVCELCSSEAGDSVTAWSSEQVPGFETLPSLCWESTSVTRPRPLQCFCSANKTGRGRMDAIATCLFSQGIKQAVRQCTGGCAW